MWYNFFSQLAHSQSALKFLSLECYFLFWMCVFVGVGVWTTYLVKIYSWSHKQPKGWFFSLLDKCMFIITSYYPHFKPFIIMQKHILYHNTVHTYTHMCHTYTHIHVCMHMYTYTHMCLFIQTHKWSKSLTKLFNLTMYSTVNSVPFSLSS